MPSIHDLYGKSQGLKATDLQGRAHLVKVDKVRTFDFTEGAKLILSFVGKEKELVLNTVNARAIASKHGDDYSTWAGAEVELYPDVTNFKGQIVPCIRVRIPVPAASSEDMIEF